MVRNLDRLLLKERIMLNYIWLENNNKKIKIKLKLINEIRNLMTILKSM